MLGIGTGLASKTIIGFEPSDVSSMIIHLSSKYGLSINTETNRVTSWSSQNSIDLKGEPPASSNRPILIPSPNSIKFSGSGVNGDYLNIRNSVGAAEFSLEAANGWSLFWVATTTDFGNSDNVILGQSSVNNNQLIFESAINIRLKTNGSNFDFEVQPSSLVNNDYYVFMLSADSTGDVKLFINNVINDTVTGVTNDIDLSRIGGNGDGAVSTLPLNIKEIIAYNKELTETERLKLYNYLSPLIPN